ncbi:MAG: haloacid dehalogenase-like hydrolase [Ignavibacteriales bacterium]|nr:MAG: haloacid dehalogenase-like hydrolase [Ignavibacteriales bacterium]
MQIHIRYLQYFILCLSLIWISACSCQDDFSSNNYRRNDTHKLERINWSQKNFEVLNQFIDEYGIGGKYYSKQKPPYVVLDWDQTCVHLDTEEAVMRYQLTNFDFKLSKTQFKELLKDSINGVNRLSSVYHNILLRDINEDLINDYSFLYDNYSGFGGKLTLDELKQTPEYKDFIVRVAFLYDGYCNTPGIEAVYGYPWVLYLFAGHTTDEIKTLSRKAIDFELANTLSKPEWNSPSDLQTKSGIINYSFKSGLRVYAEMQNLIAVLIASGIDVFVVSASYKPVVEVFSGIGNYGYNIPAENIIAMELETDEQGKILPKYKTGWSQVQRQGKVDAINLAIKQKLRKDWDPVFSAADSDGDYEMCTSFTGTKLTLILNRIKKGDIGKLCQQAVNEKDSPNPRFILQGRNENTGLFLPCSESVLLGQTELKLLP